MTSMQMAFSELLEKARHDRETEGISRQDVEEKVRHDKATEGLTASQQQLDKYLGELTNQTKLKEILTKAEVDKLKIATDKAIADAKQRLSNAEFANLVRKTDAEIKKLTANTAESLANAEQTRKMTPALIEQAEARALKDTRAGLGSLSGVLANAYGKLAVTEMKSDAIKANRNVANIAATAESRPNNGGYEPTNPPAYTKQQLEKDKQKSRSDLKNAVKHALNLPY